MEKSKNFHRSEYSIHTNFFNTKGSKILQETYSFLARKSKETCNSTKNQAKNVIY